MHVNFEELNKLTIADLYALQRTAEDMRNKAIQLNQGNDTIGYWNNVFIFVCDEICKRLYKVFPNPDMIENKEFEG